MVERINPGEGTPPVFFPEEPRKQVEPTERIDKDEHDRSDSVEISKEAMRRYKQMKRERAAEEEEEPDEDES